MGKFTYTNDDGRWMRITRFYDPAGIKPDVTLLPMIHIGERGFYEEIFHEVWCHDVCYFEGCWMPGHNVLHFLYRLASICSGLRFQGAGSKATKKIPKLIGEDVTNSFGLDEYIKGLACNCGECPDYSYRLIRADFHEEQARHAIAKIPLWLKLSLPFFALAALFMIPFIVTRDLFMEELDSDEQEDDLFKGFGGPLWTFIRDDRDAFLRKILHDEILAPRNAGKSLCVKYGANHMKRLADFLIFELGYELAERRDVLAVKADKNKQIDDEKVGYGVAKAAFTLRYYEKTGTSSSQVEPHSAELDVTYPVDVDIKETNLEWLDIDAQLQTSETIQMIEGPFTYVAPIGTPQDYRVEVSYPNQPMITDMDYDGLPFQKAEDAPDSDEAKEEV